MEELINDIENISINSNNADDLNIRDSERNDHCYDHEDLSHSKTQLEDYSILSLTPVKDKNQFRNCILCRDYLSPICKECSNHTLKIYRKNKLKNKIIPDGKVKALAKQFEDILPEAMNNGPNFPVVNDDFMLEKSESANYQIDLSSNPIIEYANTDIKDSSNSRRLEDVSNFSDKDFENLHTKSKTTKNQLTPIIDPNLCEQIDPIKAIITYTNSHNNPVETLDTENSKSNDSQIISIKAGFKNVLECNFQENNLIFDTFESLNPLEQRALLLKWITDTLKPSEDSSRLSEDELQEIITILKGIVNELEHNEIYNEFKNSPSKNVTKPHNILNNQISNGKDKNELKILNIKNSKMSLFNSKLQINIGIPEDEEIEEEHINELVFRRYNHIGCNFESNSVIIDEDSLSPKSEIALDNEELVENSIKEIGYNFFGFFK
ncbi:uncharacterized protein cubi_02970 [Cryptosporidium ubiquitum]|uniref:Uncharacterized protein n=1 Tax=Cryptosporidium ubiquitum TaxID=857276 RepID=A0A1J4MKX5_9CRYT|nr:uncharacterized protein cubi_02970 [Cryptosporidium ubiquitum]OII74838.1 hypothetical protein cubi_02970 [Cryptosporidium ubiquitum]